MRSGVLAGSRNARGMLAAVTAQAAIAVSCGPFTNCPTSVEAAVSDGVPGETDATLVAIGRVIRFVPLTSGGHRGYDIDLRRVFAGDAVEGTVFLNARTELPGVEQLSPVLVVAEVSGRRPQMLAAGRCDPPRPISGRCEPPRPISETEFSRWLADS